MEAASGSTLTGYDMHFNPRKYFNMTRPAASGSQTHLVIAEDNEAVIKIIRKCRSIALRHLPRTHKIDVTWLFEVCEAPEIHLRHVKTDSQVADLLTKGFNSPDKWGSLLKIAQIHQGSQQPGLGAKA